MTRFAPPLLVLAVVPALGACPSSDENPERLWLGLDGTETQVKLIDYEPPPY